MRRNNKGDGRGHSSSNFGKFRSNYGPRAFTSGPREMHKATCSDCGNECEVPFKPTEGKPVYCRTCYAKHKPKRF